MLAQVFKPNVDVKVVGGCLSDVIIVDDVDILKKLITAAGRSARKTR